MEDAKKSLYQRIGGEAGIERMAIPFYDRVLAKPELAPYFRHVPMERLKSMQKEFFSEALGGPLFFVGRSLRQVHAGMGITREVLRSFAECMLETLEGEVEDFKLTRQDVDRMYSRIAPDVDRVVDDVAESG